jgi:hypothetical protein
MRFCLVLLLLLSTEFASPQDKKEEHTFPTKDQIELLLTQSERAFDAYEQTVAQEAAAGKRQMDASTLLKGGVEFPWA